MADSQMTDPMTCATFRELSAELALATLDAQARAGALAHAEQCPACRQELRGLTEVADSLADLAPLAEPPAGFESRVVAALGRARASETTQLAARRHRTRRRVLQVVAAAAVAVLVGVGGWAVGHGQAPGSPARRVVSAPLVAGRQPVGQVVISTGADPWISMAVSADLGAPQVRCQLRDRDGTLTTVGAFSLAGGYGYWAAPVPPGRAVTGAQLVDPGGHVLAAANVQATTS